MEKRTLFTDNHIQLMYRAKKDGKAPNSHARFSMIDSNVFNLSQAPFCSAGSTPGTTRQLDQVRIRDQERHDALPLGYRP